MSEVVSNKGGHAIIQRKVRRKVDQGRGCRERCCRRATETTASPY
jgi:hypothetical protein